MPTGNVSFWAPVVSITLPIVVAILAAAWLQNKRIDDLRSEMRAGFAQVRSEMAEIKATVREIQAAIANLDRRVAVLEQRLAPSVRG